MRTPIETIEALLQPTLGSQTCVDEAEHPFHPDALAFYNEDPKAGFDGVTKMPMFETNLLLDEMDDDCKYRLERKGDVLVFTRYTRRGGCTLYASGQAIVCAPGSDAESVFAMGSMADVMEHASEPVRCAMDAMRKSGLSLSSGFEQHLREQVFGKESAR